MSFLADYEQVTSGNECPVIFHKWAALSTISHLVGRKVWVNWGEILGDIHAHMYIVFVGNAGSGKSTAMKLSRKIVQNMKDYPIASESMTKEVITQLMGSDVSKCRKSYNYNGKKLPYSHLSFFCNELVNLINSGGNPIGMIDFFTDIWDQQSYKVETKQKGNDIIEGPYTPMLACLTTKTAKSLQSQKIISSGFLRRCLFIHGRHEGKSVAFPEFTDSQAEAYERLMEHAKRLSDVTGQVIWLPEARATFTSWYDTNTRRKGVEHDEILLEFLQTKPEYVIKVAMLLALAENDIQLALTSDGIKRAVSLVTEVEEGGRLLFSGTGANDESPVATEIHRLLETEKLPVRKKTIYRLFMKDAPLTTIDSILQSLIMVDKAKLYSIKKLNGVIDVYSTPEKMKLFEQQVTNGTAPEY